MLNSKELIKHTQNLSILFVEDYTELRHNTTEILKNFFKYVESATDGLDALKKYTQYYEENETYYDIVLSDIQMPKLNGIDLTEELYKLNQNQSIVILSAHDDTKHLLPLVNLGIEHFIKKPIDFQELLEVLYNTSKKINTKLNDTPKNTNSIIKFSKDVFYDRDNKSLISQSQSVYLTKYEIIFLQYLSSVEGKIYTSEDIVAHYVAKGENLDIQNIRKLVSKLRKKLPSKAIKSVYGIGYKLITLNNKS